MNLDAARQIIVANFTNELLLYARWIEKSMNFAKPLSGRLFAVSAHLASPMMSALQQYLNDRENPLLRGRGR